MKKIFLLSAIVLIAFGFVGFANSTQAATCSAGGTYYIRAGAAGTGSGADWANAFPGFSATAWCRGATYYVAAGTYGSFNLNAPESGSSYITIKKSTDNDHGTNIGWTGNSSSFGLGQAVLTGPININTGYYKFDGVTGGGPNSWMSGHGFKVLLPNYATSGFLTPDGIHNLSFSHIEFTQIGGSVAGAHPNDAFYNPDALANNLYFGYNYFHDLSGLAVYLGHGSGVTLEYNYFDNLCGAFRLDIGQHCETLVARGFDNLTARYNIFKKSTGSGDLVTNGGGDNSTADNWEVYGNVFYNNGSYQTTNDGVGSNDWRVFNNTIIGGVGEIKIGGGSGNLVYNNIFDLISSIYPPQGTVTYDYDIWTNPPTRCDDASQSQFTVNYGPHENGINGGCAANGGGDRVIPLPAASFKNVAGNDFSLAKLLPDWIQGKTTISSDGTNVCQLSTCKNGICKPLTCDATHTYNIDMYGHARTNWTRGAIEYGGSTPNQPSPTPTPTPVITPTPTPVITPSPTPVPNGISYIRAGATGRGDGSSWANAYPNLAAVKWQRGLTYYLADGSYPSYAFNLPAGTSYVTIKKATAADHGPAADWSSSLGDGQAVLGPLTVNSSYLKIDGAARNEGNWSDQNSYGLKIAGMQNGDKALLFGAGTDHIQILNSAITSPGTSQSTSISSASDGVYAISGSHDLVFSHDSFDTFNRAPFVLGGLNNVTLEYSYIARDNYNPTVHAEALADEGSSNFTIRYNIFEQIDGTGYIVELERGNTNSTASNWNIYGNVFRNSKGDGVGRGVVTVINGQIVKNWNFYNNTIDNVHGYCSGFELQEAGVSSGGLQNYNNLWLNSDSAQMNCVSTPVVRAATGYNYFINTSHDNESNMQTGTADPFTNAAGGDYRLRAATMAGKTLAAPFDQDVTGASRGADGFWDRGAIEYDGFSSDTVTPTPTPIITQTPTPTPTPDDQCINLTQDLSLGDGEVSGPERDDVIKLQSFLITRDFLLSNGGAPGFFGEKTRKAVVRFQKTFLASSLWTGNVGLLTRQKISDLTCH